MAKQPIATAPRDGTAIFVMRGPVIAIAHWSRPDDEAGMWALGHREDGPTLQLDFAPSHWSYHASDFSLADQDDAPEIEPEDIPY